MGRKSKSTSSQRTDRRSVVRPLRSRKRLNSAGSKIASVVKPSGRSSVTSPAFGPRTFTLSSMS